MRRIYVEDWIPARKVAADGISVPTGPTFPRGSRGIGFTPVVVRAGAVPTKGAKRKVASLTLPTVVNGPLSQRAERSKQSLRGTRGYGIAGSGSMAMYMAAWNQAKQGVIDGIAVTQKALDKIDSTLIGVDQQIASLRDAAGPSAPNDVLAVVDKASSQRRDYGDSVESLRATIDSMNEVAAATAVAEKGGSIGAGSPAQQALDKAYQTSKTLAAQVTTMQRSGAALQQQVEAATQTVNRYVDQVNAQAALLQQQQAQQAQATDIAYQLTDQQKALAAQQAAQQAAIQQAQAAQDAAVKQAQAAQQQQIAQQQADQAAAYAQAQAQAQAQMQQQLQAQQQQFQQYLAQLQAQQQQYQPPSYPSIQYPPQPQGQYGGGAQYAPQYAPPAYAPPPAPIYSVDDTAAYQTPQYGGYGPYGPGAASEQWRTYVEGIRGVGATAPAPPSSAALAQATARQVLAQANLKLADARKQVEQQRIADEQAAAKKAAPPPEESSWWTPARKVGGALLGGVAAGLGIAALRKKG